MRRLEHLICTEIVLVGAKAAPPIWGLDGGVRTVLLMFCRGDVLAVLDRDTLDSCGEARNKSAFASSLIKFSVAYR